MPVTNYLTVDGEILAERRDAQKRDYLPDPLGSTRALLDSSQTKTDTYSYWPYGEERPSTGNTETPFRFVGTLGYFKEGAGKSYVRARYYSHRIQNWLTVDPLWPGLAPYQYVDGRPVTFVDPLGLQATTDVCGAVARATFGDFCSRIPGNIGQALDFAMCVKRSTPSNVTCDFTSAEGSCLSRFCKNPPIISCNDPAHCCEANDYPCAHTEFNPIAKNCDVSLCTVNSQWPAGGCVDGGGDLSIPPLIFNLIHEVMHCCGVEHGTDDTAKQCNDIISCCFFNVYYGGDPKRCKR